MKTWFLVTLTLCLGLSSVVEARGKADIKSFIFGAEIRNYLYSEPDFVSHSGYLYGIWGDWSWQSSLGFGKTSGELQFGALAYDGHACNLAGTVCSPLTSTTNDIIVKVGTRFEHAFNSSARIFYGGGFRYLNDKGDGASFYTRAGEWIFLPVGVVFNTDSSLGKLFFEFEYDYVIYGVVKSSLSEVNSSLNDISSNQKGGYGLVASCGISLSENLTSSLIYESWNANDSDVMSSGGQTFREPANTSQALGLRFGYLF